MPKVFISYSWEDEAHKQWVKSLADRLIENGIEAMLDQYDLTLGDRLPVFMEQAITSADYVLIICTPTYKEKADHRKGGVGYEGHIISGELFAKGNERKFIPVIRKGSASTALPTYLSGKLGIDLSESADDESSFKDLITTIWGAKQKPTIGKKPAYLTNSFSKKSDTKEEEGGAIAILGIITDRVTIPRMEPEGQLYTRFRSSCPKDRAVYGNNYLLHPGTAPRRFRQCIGRGLHPFMVMRSF